MNVFFSTFVSYCILLLYKGLLIWFFCGGNEFVGLKNIDVAYGGAAKRLVSVQTILENKTFYN